MFFEDMNKSVNLQLMSAGTSQNAYAAAGSKLNIALGQGQTVYKKVLKKAYEIFIHALKYNVEKALGCPKCPLGIMIVI